jgi:hypothetical protein
MMAQLVSKPQISWNAKSVFFMQELAIRIIPITKSIRTIPALPSMLRPQQIVFSL